MAPGFLPRVWWKRTYLLSCVKKLFSFQQKSHNFPVFFTKTRRYLLGISVLQSVDSRVFSAVWSSGRCLGNIALFHLFKFCVFLHSKVSIKVQLCDCVCIFNVSVHLFSSTGSIASKVFHEVLMDTCSELPSHCWPQDCGKKRKKDRVKSSQTEGKRSKPQRKDTPEEQVPPNLEQRQNLSLWLFHVITSFMAVTTW